jgi:hypothetical protein
MKISYAHKDKKGVAYNFWNLVKTGSETITLFLVASLEGSIYSR